MILSKIHRQFQLDWCKIHFCIVLLHDSLSYQTAVAVIFVISRFAFLVEEYFCCRFSSQSLTPRNAPAGAEFPSIVALCARRRGLLVPPEPPGGRMVTGGPWPPAAWMRRAARPLAAGEHTGRRSPLRLPAPARRGGPLFHKKPACRTEALACAAG